MQVTVKANTNIALVKYWGKRDQKLKTPLNNSISLTLDQLYTITSAEFTDSEDKIIFEQQPSEKSKRKIIDFINLIRNDFGKKEKLLIKTENNFPTASGLASSASGFAALASAINEIYRLNLPKTELSKYARIGSGSACRSVYGGFSEWEKGIREDGSDSYAIQIADQNYWDIRMLVVIIENKQKEKGSTEGMEETVRTCPFYPAWLETIDKDLTEVRNGILAKDLEKVGKTMEHNCLKMHSTMFTTIPAVIYWQPATLAIIHKVYEMRKNSIECYFTIDAGANVKILCNPDDVFKINEYLKEIKEIKQIIECKPGSEVQLL